MIRHRQAFAAGLLIALLFPGALAAAEPGFEPGIYRGRVRQDRWGQKLLQHGRQAWLLSDEAFVWLQPTAGKPVAVEVTGLSRPDPSGPGRIQAIAGAAVEPVPLAMSLELRFDPHHHLAGETLLATVSIRNLGPSSLDVRRKKLRLIVMRRSELGLLDQGEGVLGVPGRPHLGTEPGAVRDGRGPWILVREIPGEWRNTSPVGVLEPGVTLRQTFAFGEDLPTGEHEIFAVWGERDDPAVPQPTSEVRTFELNAP